MECVAPVHLIDDYVIEDGVWNFAGRAPPDTADIARPMVYPSIAMNFVKLNRRGKSTCQ
jgi:hypothetical protein